MASAFPSREMTTETTTDMIFALGRLLHQAGHCELAALLGGVFDALELHQRQGRDQGFLAPLARRDDSVLTYVTEQLGQLADILDADGQRDRAALLRVPALLQAYKGGEPVEKGEALGLLAAAGGC